MALTKWSDNKAAAILQGNYDGYIQSSLLQLRLGAAISASATNGAAVYNITENTTYKVRLYMDTRFRVAACSSIAMNTVMVNYYRDAADKSDTTVAGVYKETEITSEAGQVYMPVVYWASGGSKSWQEVYDTIEVSERLSGTLTLKSAPTKLEYAVGEEIDLTGLSLAVAWSDGSEDVVTDYTVSGFDSSVVGTKTVTVTYQDETVTFEVVVQTVAVTGIEITTLPIKTDYAMGEKLDLTGMVVTAVYEDGTRAEVSGYGVSGYDAAVAGRQMLTVTYQGFTSTFEVVVAYPTKKFVLGDNVMCTLNLATYGLTVSGTGRMEDVDYYSCFARSDEDFAKIKAITIQEGVVSIGSSVFYDCASLTSVKVADSITSIGNDAFSGCTSLISINIPEGVASINGWTFQGCESLTSIAIPEGVTIIESFAFSGCTSLTSINIPGGATIIGMGVFRDCTSLTSIIIPEGVTIIEENTFEGCTGLTSINIPEGVDSIGPWAFRGCAGLKKIVISNSDCYIYDEADTIDSVATICGHTGSTAEAYATKYNRTFVSIGEGKPTGIEVTNPPTKVEYRKGEEFIPDGLVVSVVYSDGTKEPVTDYTLSGFDSSAIGVVTVTVTYQEFTAGFDVTILPPAVIGIEITTLPGKLKYGLTDAFDGTGLVVTASYSDGTREPVGDYTVSGFNSTSTGIKAITIIYQDYTADFTVEVMPDVTVTFNDLYGGLIEVQTVHYGRDAVPPAAPEMLGFVLSGWSGSYTNVVEDTVCQAQYAVQTFTVQFIDHDGTVLDTQTVRYLDDATPPADPAHAGYLFAGWSGIYTDVTKDVTITALYKPDIKVTAIQASDIEIKNGELAMLSFTVLPADATDKSVAFESEDESIVSVNQDGTLQANNAGSTTITISAKDGSGVTATCTITVAADDEVTSLWLIPNDFYLQIGKTMLVTAETIAGDDADTALLWTSSDTRIATVDKSGKVKGVAAGTATITSRLKSDAAIFATSKVEVTAREDYIRELYADDSVHKETVIHSVDGRFDDITNEDIKEESMVIKEAVCGSAPVYLGGCISNSFEILVHTKRFFKKPPSGEIQVYQKVGGVKVNLFHGIIDTAKKQEDKITRKLIAYDKMHTAGDVNISPWFKKMKFPITVGSFRKKLFKKIGISHQGVKLPCDDLKIDKHYIYYAEGNEGDVIDPAKAITRRHDIYSVPDTLKAVDVIRDICEVNGRWGWMNRTGAFEYVDPYVFDLDYVTGEKEKKYLHPIKIQDDDKSYAVKAVEVYMDDKEIDPYVYVWGGGSYSNKYKYSIDDSNFILSATRGLYPAVRSLTAREIAIAEEIAGALHDKSWVSFTCTQRFDPTIKIGTDVYYENVKKLSDGTSYKWTTYSAVLERTIKGCQSMLETVSASVGPLSSSSNKKKKTVDKTKKNEKTVSDIKREVSNLGSNYYGNGGGGSGGGTQPGGGLKAVSVASLPSNPDSNTIYLIQGEVTVN